MKDELETNLAGEEAAKLNETNTPAEVPEQPKLPLLNLIMQKKMLQVN